MPRNAPRVLVSGVVLGQPMGGVRRHNQELLPRVARLLEQHGGGLAVLEGREALALRLPDSVRRLPSDVPARPLLVRAAKEGRAIARVLAAARADGAPFDLVHTAHLPAPRRIAAPFTLTVHDLRSLELAHTPMSRRLVARHVVGDAVLRAAAVLTVSETVRARLLERFRLDPARVRLVPNAADHFRPLPRSAGPGAPLLHVGHLERRKNLDLLVRALALAPDLPELLLAGAPRAGEGERLERLARELGVEARVRFLGPFDDAELPGLYAKAACLVLPSRLEGFGIPVLEAQRAGVPVAIADAGALPEVAGDGTPRFAPDDPEACVRAIRAALCQDETALARAAASAAHRTWDASARAWFEAWRAVTG